MTTQDNTWKSETFATELSYIKDEGYRELAKNLIQKLPDYTFKIAASSTGKYHPKYTNGEGGLVRHTKAAVRIAVELMRLEMYSGVSLSHDAIIVALLLHDGFKHGFPDEDGSYPKYSISNHSEVCANWLISLGLVDTVNAKVYRYIADLVLTHMGQWNTDYKSGRMFAPKPATMEQCFVHLCDYLASRKCLEFDESVELSK